MYHRQLWGLVVLGMTGLFCARLGVAQVITEAWWLASMRSGLLGLVVTTLSLFLSLALVNFP